MLRGELNVEVSLALLGREGGGVQQQTCSMHELTAVTLAGICSSTVYTHTHTRLSLLLNPPTNKQVVTEAHFLMRAATDLETGALQVSGVQVSLVVADVVMPAAGPLVVDTAFSVSWANASVPDSLLQVGEGCKRLGVWLAGAHVASVGYLCQRAVVIMMLLPEHGVVDDAAAAADMANQHVVSCRLVCRPCPIASP